MSLCLGNYSDISSHTFSMTCIGNHSLNKHIQSKFGKRSGFFWAKHRNCSLPCVGPRVKETWPLQMITFQKRIHVLPSSLDRPYSSAQTSPGASTATPTLSPQQSSAEGQRRLPAGGYSFVLPRGSNREQKQRSHVISQNTGNWKHAFLVSISHGIYVFLSYGTCSSLLPQCRC